MGSKRLAGRSTLISGGASGCGAAAARLFAGEGARVTIVDRQVELGEKLAAEIRGSAGEAIFAAADVSKADAVKAAVAAATAAFGPPTALFNHAGSIVVKPFLETTEAEYDWLMNVNVRSMFLMTQAVLPGMLARGKGVIVNTSSVSAELATPLEVLYCTTKAACHMFTKAIATEYREQGIRCNAVAPGFIRTAHGLREIDDLRRHGVNVQEQDIADLQGRICEPEEIARAALFLASDDASFVNGECLFVDNGLMVRT